MSYSIRNYQSPDVARVQEITAATFSEVSIDNNMERTFGSFGPSDWKTRKVAAIAEDCRIQPDGVFVAISEAGEIVGYITTRLDTAGGIGRIPNLAVDPAHQGKGLGRALLKRALEFFSERGMAIAKIETLEQNPVGQGLYSSLGFVEVARQIHFAMRLYESTEAE